MLEDHPVTKSPTSVHCIPPVGQSSQLPGPLVAAKDAEFPLLSSVSFFFSLSLSIFLCNVCFHMQILVSSPSLSPSPFSSSSTHPLFHYSSKMADLSQTSTSIANQVSARVGISSPIKAGKDNLLEGKGSQSHQQTQSQTLHSLMRHTRRSRYTIVTYTEGYVNPMQTPCVLVLYLSVLMSPVQ